MKTIVVSVVITLLSAALFLTAAKWVSVDSWSTHLLLLAAGATSLLLAVLIALTQVVRRGSTTSVWRLDLFFPTPRGKNTWKSLRKLLRFFGPTVVSSPLRRLVQAGCFLLFLSLFFYVCWPYGARPAKPGRISTGWRFVELEQSTGFCHFRRQTPEKWQLDEGTDLHLVDPTVVAANEALVSSFQIASWNKAILSTLR